MKIKKVSDALGMEVYTDSGDYFGKINGVNFDENRIESWVISLGEAAASLISTRGVIIPNQYVKAIGDIFIITKNALPVQEVQTEETLEI